jgi:hypothetical protein
VSAAEEERSGPVPRPRAWGLLFVQRIAELAGQGLGDREIAEEMQLTKAQVFGIRTRYQIPAGRQRGCGPVVAGPAGPLVPSDVAPNVRWCALLAAADGRVWSGMRRAVCQALQLSTGVSDETMIVAAQQDPRSPDELADAYLLALGGHP